MAAMVISISMVKGEPMRSAAMARFATGATPIRQAAMKAQWANSGEASSLTPQAAVSNAPVPITSRPLAF